MLCMLSLRFRRNLSPVILESPLREKKMKMIGKEKEEREIRTTFRTQGLDYHADTKNRVVWVPAFISTFLFFFSFSY